MSKELKLKQRMILWKEKAVERAKIINYLRKEIKRIKKERDKYKNEVKKLKKEQKQSSSIPDKVALIYITLQIFLIGNISFQGVSRVLGVIGSYLGLSKTPCVQTVINWVTRLSISRMQNVFRQIKEFSNGFICMIDISIGLGAGKILAVILLDAKHHILRKGAPTLKNVKCVGVSVADTWTGETIADFLQKVIAVVGEPVAYLKDGGTDLGKAARLLNERGHSSLSIDDISHAIANLLKHEYQEHPMFETFISACGKISKKFKQSILACLVPPKVSTKARFMNLHRLVRWAEQLLKHSTEGHAENDSILSKLRNALGQLPECKGFINLFLRDANSLLECEKVLKTKGLSQKTYKECQHLVETIPEPSAVRIGFVKWMEDQLSTAVRLGLDEEGMPVSSDSIESLFGVAKHHGTGEIKDANRIALRIPALCSELTKEDAQNVLDITLEEQQKVVKSLPSLVKQRRKVLPNPGSLEEIPICYTKQNLELIPVPKKLIENLPNTDIPYSYNNTTVPFIDLKKQIELSINLSPMPGAA